MADRPVSIPMTLSDHWPGFHGHGVYKSNMSKTVHHTDNITIEH